MNDSVYTAWKKRIESELRPPAVWDDLGAEIGPGVKVAPIHVSAPQDSGNHVPSSGTMRYEPVVRSAAELRALRQLDTDLPNSAVISTSVPVEAMRGAEDLSGISVRPTPDARPEKIEDFLAVIRERRTVAATGLLIDPLALACFCSKEQAGDFSPSFNAESLRFELLRFGRSDVDDRVAFGAVDALAVQDAGAGLPTILAWTLLSLSAWLDRLEPEDLEPDGLIGRLRILVPVGNRPIIDAAFVTCVRDLTSALVDAYAAQNGGPDHPALPVLHAVSSSDGIVRSAAPADDAGNLVRATLQAIAASSAGADILSLLPYDAHREPTPDSIRLSAGVYRLLHHESGMNGPSEPLAGSYTFETIVRAVSEAAKSLFIDLSEDLSGDMSDSTSEVSTGRSSGRSSEGLSGRSSEGLSGRSSRGDRLRNRIEERISLDRAESPDVFRVGLDSYAPEAEVDAT